ncbi:uncharacterized protein BDZ83DRAFT_292838 [Colletotrichum acutatum]|uniref:Uncharacterized protein n=1 Tax=Glomerella acutata TaxID=27357 RepID=A0AAD9D226_GLOAC|nr:uncharacterized protein BDZ83DRAFT_292838 [Colletotrichum acutatum]KAK1731002.1 hypothetical protein BDZ83DRAFT_292838 [Colletotrichum acutatum]
MAPRSLLTGPVRRPWDATLSWLVVSPAAAYWSVTCHWTDEGELLYPAWLHCGPNVAREPIRWGRCSSSALDGGNWEIESERGAYHRGAELVTNSSTHHRGPHLRGFVWWICAYPLCCISWAKSTDW